MVKKGPVFRAFFLSVRNLWMKLILGAAAIDRPQGWFRMAPSDQTISAGETAGFCKKAQAEPKEQPPRKLSGKRTVEG
jgi:hypothetical protein